MYSQYLGKDKVVGFAQPIAEDVEVHALADHDEIAEMMWGPQNHIPRKTQAKYKMPIIPLDNAFITSPVFQDQEEWTCRTPTSHQAQGPLLMHSVRNTPGFSLKGMRTLVEHNWLKWTLM